MLFLQSMLIAAVALDLSGLVPMQKSDKLFFAIPYLLLMPLAIWLDSIDNKKFINLVKEKGYTENTTKLTILGLIAQRLKIRYLIFRGLDVDRVPPKSDVAAIPGAGALSDYGILKRFL
jgi:hypothetical protein